MSSTHIRQRYTQPTRVIDDHVVSLYDRRRRTESPLAQIRHHIQAAIGQLVRRLSRQMQKEGALFNFDIIFLCRGGATVLSLLFALLLCDDFDFNAVDTTEEFCLEQWFALLLAAFIARSRTRAVDSRGHGNAICLESLVAIDSYEKAIHSVGERDGDLGYNLDVRVDGGNDHRSTVRSLLLVGKNGDRPWLGRRECRMSVECNFGYQGFFMTCIISAPRSGIRTNSTYSLEELS